MELRARLNRDFYIKMRIKGYTHQTLTTDVFPPERQETFCNDVKDLETVDFTKKSNLTEFQRLAFIEKLVAGVKPKKN